MNDLMTTYISLFITTVMQALNVMANWQLWTNTAQQMFKVFAFGFDMRIKTILPLWLSAWSVMLC